MNFVQQVTAAFHVYCYSDLWLEQQCDHSLIICIWSFTARTAAIRNACYEFNCNRYVLHQMHIGQSSFTLVTIDIVTEN